MPGSPYFDGIPKGILTWPIFAKVVTLNFVFIFFMFALPNWWVAVFVTSVTISLQIWFVTRPSKMLEISSIDS